MTCGASTRATMVGGLVGVIMLAVPTCGFVVLPTLRQHAHVSTADIAGESRNTVRPARPGCGVGSHWQGGRRSTRMHSAPTAEVTCGTVTYVPENEELAAEETVEVIYTPPEGLFKDPDSLLYCGGFNGWDGEDDALTTPMMPTNDGRFRVSITVPNFAKVMDFVVTDGVRYDTGPDGSFFHALVTHVREADKAGNIITYRQEADGQLIKTGLIPKVDPQELERMINEATKTEEAKSAGPAAPAVAEPMVAEDISDVEAGMRQEVVVTIDEQAAVQKMRAEASVLGERLGLGNMQVNEARDAYDVYDDKEGRLAFESLGKVLEKLGFDEVNPEMQAELIGRHVLTSRPDASTMSLVEFMYLFKELDDTDVGIDMC